MRLTARNTRNRLRLKVHLHSQSLTPTLAQRLISDFSLIALEGTARLAWLLPQSSIILTTASTSALASAMELAILVELGLSSEIVELI